jgi:predicted enzyme related to lactoylglutathione lyase
MPEFDSYPPGTPCWVDLATPDLATARDFYTAVFGWQYDESPPEAGGYLLARERGKTVAGLMPMQDEQAGSGSPAYWTTYLATDDAEALARQVGEHGGEVMVGPMPVMDQGSMLLWRDPTGAVAGAWQPGAMRGAELGNEHGSVIWSELLTRDLAAARRFYVDVFGYQTAEMDLGMPDPYVMIKVGEHEVGGLMTMPAELPGQVPAYWNTYFAVDDVDAALETVRQRGGRVDNDPIDAPYGRFAPVADPAGAAFTLLTPPSQG